MTRLRRAVSTTLAATGALALAGTLLAGTPASAAVVNPLAGQRLFVNPNTNAMRALKADPAHATLLKKIALRPQGAWFVGGTPAQLRTDLTRVLVAARAARAVPLLVAYDLPSRDCGSYSRGGALGATAYDQWSYAFAAALGTSRAIVVVEPDALMQMSCLSRADQSTQLYLLRHFVARLHQHAGVTTYLDSGKSGAQPVATMRARLVAAGVGNARGFSLNVSGFNTTAGEVSYGRQVAAGLGPNGHFVIDTGRNGRGPLAGVWCNPTGRGLGTPPTTSTGVAGVDAYLWVKPPGASDGACVPGAPAAGAWWHTYALGLASRSLTP